VKGRTGTAWKIVAGILALAGPLLGQVKVGDNVDLSANGTVSANYQDTWGNLVDSSHGLGFGFAGTVSGYYYDPKFLSFSASPYFNQSKSNSDFGSLTNASGIVLNSQIFSGSRFPGSVYYSTAYNSQGNFGVPGLPSFTTNGDNQNFGVNWSARVQDYPSLTVGYLMGDNHYDLYGTDQQGSGGFRNFFANSNYTVAGFALTGGFGLGNSHSSIPGVISGEAEQTGHSDNKDIFVSASHPLPWAGSFSTTYNRDYMNSDYQGYRFNGTIDTLVGTSSFHPTEKLTFSVGADYSDNLNGLLYQATFPLTPSTSATGSAGTTTSPGLADPLTQASSTSSHSWDLTSGASYSFAPNLMGQAGVQRRQQYFEGQDYSSTNFGGGVNYNRRIAGGAMGAGVYLNGNHVDQTGENNFGMNANASYNRNIKQWNFGSSFSYGQNVQTLLITELNSYYTVSGNVGRAFARRLYWNMGGSAFRTGYTTQEGTSSSGESITTNFGFGRMGFGASYAQSRGTGLATSNGIISTPLPPIVPTDLQILYGGHGYSFSVSGSPIRHLTFNANYSNNRSNTDNQGLMSWNKGDVFSSFVQYHFRQLNINGGYSRLIQGFSASTLPQENLNSFSIGISRWFNLF
jgi:hypothetical protein